MKVELGVLETAEEMLLESWLFFNFDSIWKDVLIGRG